MIVLYQVDTGIPAQAPDSQQKTCFPQRVTSAMAGPGADSTRLMVLLQPQPQPLGRGVCLQVTAGDTAWWESN